MENDCKVNDTVGEYETSLYPFYVCLDTLHSILKICESYLKIMVKFGDFFLTGDENLCFFKKLLE